MSEEAEYLTIPQAAERFNVPVRTIYHWFQRNYLRWFIGGPDDAMRMVAASDVQELLDAAKGSGGRVTGRVAKEVADKRKPAEEDIAWLENFAALQIASMRSYMERFDKLEKKHREERAAALDDLRRALPPNPFPGPPAISKPVNDVIAELRAKLASIELLDRAGS